MDGDIEISAVNIVYEATLFFFELNSNNEVTLLQTYGNINNNYLLTLCFVNNDHFKVVYEKNESNKTNNNIILNDQIAYKILKNNVKINSNINIKLAYANDNRVIKYNDIYNYIKAKNKSKNGIYPEYIYNIKDKPYRKDKKNNFRNSIKNYYIDKKTNRLKIKIHFSNEPNKKEYKSFYIAYHFEKINLIKKYS